MYAGAVVMLVYGPHKVRKDQARKISRARRKQKPVSQCDSCEVYRCLERDSGRMAKAELLAAINDDPQPDCTDRVAPFWERINNE